MSAADHAGLVVVNSGGANLGSIMIALRRLGIQPPLVDDAASIQSAGRILLPGVGAAGPIMHRLRAFGLIDALRSVRVPLLGICVGMQVLYERSEENATLGLGLLSGAVRRLRGRDGIRVPHMGWNTLEPASGNAWSSPMLDGINPGDYAYFVHSYVAPVGQDCLATVEHGERFAALVQSGHVVGAQFHPERSAQTGARLLSNFLEWQP